MFGEKQSGLIVDYVGVFKDLERALAIYGSGTGGASGEDETPIKAKQNLLQDLARAADEVTVFLGEQGIEPQRIMASGDFDRLLLLDDAREVLARTEESKSRFLSLSRPVFRLYKAVLPDTRAAESAPLVKMLSVMVERLRQLDPEIDISVVMADVQRVLDQSITARSFVIEEAGDEEPVDLSRLDFDDLRRKFEEGRKGTEAERLKGRVNQKIREMVRLNKTRVDYQERLQRLIEEYNAGSLNIELYFNALVKIAQELTGEEQRTVSEGLSEEELAVFDLLTKPYVSLTAAENEQVKRIARDLLWSLKREKLVLDWRKRQQARAAVRVAIEEELDRLPGAFTDELYWSKVLTVYDHVYTSYAGAGCSVYHREG